MTNIYRHFFFSFSLKAITNVSHVGFPGDYWKKKERDKKTKNYLSLRARNGELCLEV